MAQQAELQFFKNKYLYPDYSKTLTAYGTSFDMAPVSVNLKSGTLKVAGTMDDFMNCNYMRITRGTSIVWAWIDDVRFHTENSFYVDYSIDAFRTFQAKIELGTQYVTRSMTPTNKIDNLLGGKQQEFEFTTTGQPWGNYNSRVLVVQVRPEPAYVVNNTPVQPTPYHFYFSNYDPNNWQAQAHIVDLFTKLRGSSAITNIVTIYNLPYMSIAGLSEVPIPLMEGTEQVATVDGFKFLSGTNDVKDLLTRTRTLEPPLPLDELMRIPHTTQVMIPEAGLMNIPDEVWSRGNVKVRQDIDIFSGASNYMITSGINDLPSGISVRGSSTSSIPVISNPYDTYISQNQNALTTSLIGDVASTVIGAGSFIMAPNMISAGVAVKGVGGLVSSYSSNQDRQNMAPSNPPSFLGTALANHYSGMFFLLSKYTKVENTSIVQSRYGYPLETITTLSIPTTGYVETKACNVSSDGSVPRWALEEVNELFNNGLRVLE